MRTFEFSDDKSNKFWNIDLQGSRYTVTYGKIGSKGQTQVKDFPDADKAQKAHDKIVAEKLGKGYVETTLVNLPPPTPLQLSLEEALAENADDLASHSAYADYLNDQGDPRGELIQVQLALENLKRSPQEVRRLDSREKELLQRHGKQWLGNLARFFLGSWSGEQLPYHCQFHRGWLDMVRVLPFPDAIIAALARSPEARLLRRLEVVYDMRYHPFDFEEMMQGPVAALKAGESNNETYESANIMPAILGSPFLTNLRIFKLGFSDHEGQIAHSTMVAPFEGCTALQIVELIQKCPHLEELYLNTSLVGIADLIVFPELDNIRVLQYYYGSDNSLDDTEPAYPLSALANNTSLTRLETLRLHPGREATIDIKELDALVRSSNLPNLTHLQVHMTNYGNEGCTRIINSGILRRLKTLDMAYGNMTDDGARLLADCPDLRHLESLNVSRNALTKTGISALRATGVRFVADDQHGPADTDYLYEVDYE